MCIIISIQNALYETEKCHGHAMNLTAGEGDNGAAPSKMTQQYLTRRVRQSADGQGCKELEELWEAFNKSADATAKKFRDNLKPIHGEKTNHRDSHSHNYQDQV
jgi:hypothetical protein